MADSHIKSLETFSKMFYRLRQHISIPYKSSGVSAHALGPFSLVSSQGSRSIVPLPHMDICSSLSLKTWTNTESVPTSSHQNACKLDLGRVNFLTLSLLSLIIKKFVPRCVSDSLRMLVTPESAAAVHTTGPRFHLPCVRM